MTLANAVTRVQGIALNLSGVKAAPSLPVESVDTLPMALAWPSSGTMEALDASQCKGLHTIRCEIYVSRALLGPGVSTLTGYAEDFGKMLAGDPTLNGSVDTIVFPVSYNLQPLQVGNIQLLALTWDIPVKIMASPSTSS